MNETKYYSNYGKKGRFAGITGICKVNKQIGLSVDDNYRWRPSIYAEIARCENVDDSIPRSDKYSKVTRITEDIFKDFFNATYEALQQVEIHGGEYYLDRRYTSGGIVFHAFFDEPKHHIVIDCRQHIESTDVWLCSERVLSKRPSMRKYGIPTSEKAFCQAYKLVLEFFFDGSAMISNQDTLIEQVKLLAGPEDVPERISIGDDYYYQQAREKMLQRKEEIKARMVDFDESPAKRRELRAEMKGIDYCIAVLDSNH